MTPELFKAYKLYAAIARRYYEKTHRILPVIDQVRFEQSLASVDPAQLQLLVNRLNAAANNDSTGELRQTLEETINRTETEETSRSLHQDFL